MKVEDGEEEEDGLNGREGAVEQVQIGKKELGLWWSCHNLWFIQPSASFSTIPVQLNLSGEKHSTITVLIEKHEHQPLGGTTAV